MDSSIRRSLSTRSFLIEIRIWPSEILHHQPNYQVSFENGLTEYEFDHVFVGRYNGLINANENEVADFDYKSMEEIRRELACEKDQYTAWFHIAFPKVFKWWKKRK